MRGRRLVRMFRVPLAVLQCIVSQIPLRARKGLVNAFPASSSLVARALRYAALKSVAEKCGEIVDIRAFCQILSPQCLLLGSRISVHPFCYIDATGGIEIGDDVSIAHGASVLSTNHSWSDDSRPIRDQPVTMSRTKIGENVWIGAGARILAGVSIGPGSIVAAGAVVTKNVAPGLLVAGVPARVIRPLKGQ